MIEKKSVSLAAVRLINADILALPTTGIELIPAPGANRIIVPIHTILHFRSSAAYTNFDTLMALYLARGSGGSRIQYHNSPDLLLGQTVNYTSIMRPATDLLDAIMTDADTDVVNKALNIKMDNALGNLTGGAAGNLLIVSTLFYIANIQL
jgi:hypothetical protein